MGRGFTALVLLLLLLLAPTIVVFSILHQSARLFFSSSSGECNSWDAIVAVLGVIDGDTFRARVTCVSRLFNDKVGVNMEYRIRLADINAPELGSTEGERARKALENLIQGRVVMLDIDSVAVFDRYGRIIAVAYIEYNSTHVLNINKWLLEEGYAEVWDHPNEFNPKTWKLYEPAREGAQTTKDNRDQKNRTPIALALLVAVLIATLTTITLLRRIRR